MNATALILLLLLLAGVAALFYRRWQKAETEMRSTEARLQDNARDITQAQTLQATSDRRSQELSDELATLRADSDTRQRQANERIAEQQARIAALEVELEKAGDSEARLRQANERTAEQQARIAALEVELETANTSADEKLKLLEKAKSEMELQFKNLAQGILEEKSRKFADDSRQQLTPLLTPLKDNIESFRRKMEQLHGENTRERAQLKTHIEHLQDNARQISTDADKLARALKGSGKMQGDWGEQVLLKLLENSGLKEGENYRAQESHKTEDGGQQRPDVVIYLPENKNIIIDSKVSLSAYVDYTAAADDGARAAALARHLDAVLAHVKRLAATDYSSLASLRSPDYVLMFMPLEPAYMLALQEDPHLFNAAYNKKVILISPTTLMPVLRTVANIWRVEKQQQYARAIAEQGGKLYDKFVGFHADMEKLGDQLQRAQKTYDDAQGKLSSGRGNIIGQAQKLREMGVDAKKELPAAALELIE